MALIDAHTTIDELVASLNMTAARLDTTTNKIYDVLLHGEPTPTAPAIITYPGDGTTKTIPAGRTVLNFVEGIVTLPTGGAPDYMSGSLRDHIDEPSCHSLVISANHEVSIRLDDAGAIAGRASILSAAGTTVYLSNVDFRKVTLETARETVIYVIASTNNHAPEIAPDVVRIVANTSADGSGTDYAVLVTPSGEMLASALAARATLLDNASILSAGTTTAVQITAVGHSMFIQIISSDVGEYTVLSSPDNVTFYECETIAVNKAATGVVAPIHPAHEYIAVRNDSPDTQTATIIMGYY